MSSCPSCAAEIPAASKFCSQCGHKLDVAAATPSQPPQPPPVEIHVRDERRDVTVLFADVSGFTSMCERLDPEEVHTVMNECFEGLGQAIRDEDGYIDKYIGDNVMALFGAPVAHEDDPARACRAALAMQAFLGSYAEKCESKTGVALRMRIGINTGLVVAGGVGSGARKDYSVMGDTVNLAARLESAAPPGGVLVSEVVEKRTSGLFEFGPPSLISVKGKQQPVSTAQLFRQLMETEVPQADGRGAEFVGRARELSQLMHRWESPGQRSQWIETRGEMGIGKTRLVREAQGKSGRYLFRVLATTDACRRPFGLARLLVYAVVREVSGQNVRPETAESFAEILLEVLGAGVDPFMDALWYLAAPSRLAVPAPDPDPESLRLTLNQGLITLIEQLGVYAPGLTLFVDSYELADDASAELLESLAMRAEGCPLPTIVASRNRERVSPHPDDIIHLTPLADEDVTTLLNVLVHGAELPDDMRHNLVMRAGGIPSYLEEMVRLLVDDGVLTPHEDGVTWVYSSDVPAVTLPTSILAAMISRLDRLERPMRNLLCQCAVQGVEFAPEVTEIMFRTVGDQDESSHVRTWLDELDQRGFVSRGRGDAWWVFRQPLMQEACYETLLLRDRRVLHAKTADALCAVAGGKHAVASELLAFHYERAEMWPEAAHASLSAGDRASDVFLNQDAIQRYDKAIALFLNIDQLSEADAHAKTLVYQGAARVQLRIGGYEIAEAHAKAMAAHSGLATDRAESDRLIASACLHTGRTEEAERLLRRVVSRTLDDELTTEVVMRARHDLAELAHRAGRIDDALEQLRECRNITQANDSLVMIRVDMLEGKILHTAGRYVDATAMYSRAYEAAERIGSVSERARASNNMGNAVRDLGHYDAAQDYFSRALKLWERMGDVECIAGARINLGNVAMSQGNFVAAREHHQQSLAVCTRIGNVQGMALAQVNVAILAIEEGDGVVAVSSAEDALRTLGTSGNRVLRGHVLAALGDGRLECGEITDAEMVFSDVLDEYDEASHPLIHACAKRGLGRVALLNGEHEKARDLFGEAIQQFEQLKRAQEAARTVLYQAEALWRLGETDRARSDLDRIRQEFTAMHADRDVAKVDQVLQNMRAQKPG